MQMTPLIIRRISIFLEDVGGCIGKAFRILFHDHLHLIKAKAGRKIESKYIISATDMLAILIFAVKPTPSIKLS